MNKYLIALGGILTAIIGVLFSLLGHEKTKRKEAEQQRDSAEKNAESSQNIAAIERERNEKDGNINTTRGSGIGGDDWMRDKD